MYSTPGEVPTVSDIGSIDMLKRASDATMIVEQKIGSCVRCKIPAFMQYILFVT